MSDQTNLRKSIEVIHGSEIAMLTDASSPEQAVKHQAKVNAYATILSIVDGDIEIDDTEKNETYRLLSKAMQEADTVVSESNDSEGIGVQ